MIEAYILLTTNIGRVKDVYNKLKKADNIKSISIVTGPFDIIALVEAEDLSTLSNTVVEEIGDIDGVLDTNTGIIVE